LAFRPVALIDLPFLSVRLAEIAGVALTLLGSTGPTLGTSYIVDAFLVVVVGGIGRIKEP
jgi:urea transport system permease protein